MEIRRLLNDQGTIMVAKHPPEVEETLGIAYGKEFVHYPSSRWPSIHPRKDDSGKTSDREEKSSGEAFARDNNMMKMHKRSTNENK